MVVSESNVDNKPSNDKPSFLWRIMQIFKNIATYTAEIIISAIVSLALLYGLFWAWTKYSSQL